ncbi:MAG: exodeoxyribonuclease VII small subunit [Bacteroidales bacterium]|jgi:exodeoxyribonuclease VII small subunit|nr:exodeoxyribonuclease VII small subunit [Bacteroidales bacterium]MDD2770656.1 exodeoxyribonuclease VII small subunit [Bacteroidales bacterium]MDD3104540.1 exodeoxyribonuclease VII small subunit [Bacteroidales bacterium]MDD3549078.1 exodeoxyribonuclease VII small subunit [Bacteroidales bacterium]MDD4064074.1 exodeoxyribonuclease VII small subunit [Bacteroidales bacterium]
MKKKTELSYEQAREELDILVSSLEQPDADLGMISAKVKRALELVSYCRDYLHQVQEDAEKTLDSNEKE